MIKFIISELSLCKGYALTKYTYHWARIMFWKETMAKICCTKMEIEVWMIQKLKS